MVTTCCRSGQAADDECQGCRLVGFFDAGAPGSPGSSPCVSDPAER